MGFQRDLIASLSDLIPKKDDPKDDVIRELRREIQQLRYRLQCAENEIFNLTYRDDMNGGFRGRTDSSL